MNTHRNGLNGGCVLDGIELEWTAPGQLGGFPSNMYDNHSIGGAQTGLIKGVSSPQIKNK